MKDDLVLQIAERCQAIEKQAAELYARLVEASDNLKVQQFWLEMAETEERHLTFWNGVQTLAEGHRVPAIFDDPARVLNELELYLRRIGVMVEHWQESKSTRSSFTLAFQLEFAMAHRAFLMFYETLDPMVRAPNPVDDYDLHIARLAEMAAWYQDESPELELLGETLCNLWETNKLLVRLVTIDELTGLLNRHGFFIFGRQLAYLAKRNKGNVGILVLDIDDLDEINKRYGLDQGDQVVRGVAEVLKANLRRSDVVGRYGGKQFILMFPAIHPEAVQKLAEQLRSQIEMAKPAGVDVTVCIGAAHGKMLLNPEEELDTLIGNAVQALASSKHERGNRILFAD